ncbi:hypothetical protein GYH30_005789, partial [Glycine max]
EQPHASTSDISEVFCRLPLPFISEEFKIDFTWKDMDSKWSSHDYRLNLGYAVLLFQCLKMFIWGIEDLYPLAVILTFSLSAYFLSISISISNGVLTYNYIIFSPLLLLYNFIIWFSCLFFILSRVPSTKLLKLKG